MFYWYDRFLSLLPVWHLKLRLPVFFFVCISLSRFSDCIFKCELISANWNVILIIGRQPTTILTTHKPKDAHVNQSNSRKTIFNFIIQVHAKWLWKLILRMNDIDYYQSNASYYKANGGKERIEIAENQIKNVWINRRTEINWSRKATSRSIKMRIA